MTLIGMHELQLGSCTCTCNYIAGSYGPTDMGMRVNQMNAFTCTCTRQNFNGTCSKKPTLKHVHVCSVVETRQSQTTMPKDNSFFPREKEELPQVGLQPAMFCVLGRRSSN